MEIINHTFLKNIKITLISLVVKFKIVMLSRKHIILLINNNSQELEDYQIIYPVLDKLLVIFLHLHQKDMTMKLLKIYLVLVLYSEMFLDKLWILEVSKEHNNSI
jgi:hypothetical protein